MVGLGNTCKAAQGDIQLNWARRDSHPHGGSSIASVCSAVPQLVLLLKRTRMGAVETCKEQWRRYVSVHGVRQGGWEYWFGGSAVQGRSLWSAAYEASRLSRNNREVFRGFVLRADSDVALCWKALVLGRLGLCLYRGY